MVKNTTNKIYLTTKAILVYLSAIGIDTRLIDMTILNKCSEEGIDNINDIYGVILSKEAAKARIRANENGEFGEVDETMLDIILKEYNKVILDLLTIAEKIWCQIHMFLEAKQKEENQEQKREIALAMALYNVMLLQIMKKRYVDDDSEDYMLEFERENQVIIKWLDIISELPLASIISLIEIHVDNKQSNREKLSRLIIEYGDMNGCILYLTIIDSSNNSQYYKMFKENELGFVDRQTMFKLACSALKSSSDKSKESSSKKHFRLLDFRTKALTKSIGDHGVISFNERISCFKALCYKHTRRLV